MAQKNPPRKWKLFLTKHCDTICSKNLQYCFQCSVFSFFLSLPFRDYLFLFCFLSHSLHFFLFLSFTRKRMRRMTGMYSHVLSMELLSQTPTTTTLEEEPLSGFSVQSFLRDQGCSTDSQSPPSTLRSWVLDLSSPFLILNQKNFYTFKLLMPVTP